MNNNIEQTTKTSNDSDNLERGTYGFTPNANPVIPPAATFAAYLNHGNAKVEQKEPNTAVQIIDFAKEQMAKLTESLQSAPHGQYDENALNGMFDVLKELIEASVRIEALNTLTKLNMSNEDVIRDIFNDSIFR